MTCTCVGNGFGSRHCGGVWSLVSAEPPQYTQASDPNSGNEGSHLRGSMLNMVTHSRRYSKLFPGTHRSATFSKRSRAPVSSAIQKLGTARVIEGSPLSGQMVFLPALPVSWGAVGLAAPCLRNL